MNPDILMKGVVASYLTSPQGMEMLHNYMSSKEGHAAIREYLITPRGRQTALDILPLVLDAVDLPGDIKNSVRENLGKKTTGHRSESGPSFPLSGRRQERE